MRLIIAVRPAFLSVMRERSCRRRAVGTVAPRARERHIRLLGILWLAISAFNTLSGLAILLVAKPVLLHLRELGQGPPEFVQGFLQPLLTLVAIFVLSKALLGFAAGWGLLRREGWARIVALIGGFLALFHPPFGTALGIYTLWVLLPSESEREYAEQASRAA